MRLDQELVKRNLSESRTEAQELIEGGFVVVNDALVLKQTRQVSEIDTIVVNGRRKYVSRGGEKLEGILYDIFETDEAIHKKILGTTALDIGSSTGGFTDCLLSYGAKHVDAVDVGTDQLHKKIRANENVSVFENTDIRNFKTDNHYDIIVGDVSFISLSNIFDILLGFGSTGTQYFLLIKPQFEVGYGNTKKGIVKDVALVSTIIASYEHLAIKNGLQQVQIHGSHLVGGDGNQEYFLYGILK